MRYIILFLSICLTVNLLGQVSAVGSNKFTVQHLGQNFKIPYYSNYNINTGNSTVTKAVIVIHGSNRDADNYYANMVTAANLRPAQTSNLLIVAPQFLTLDDINAFGLDSEHIYWSNNGWKWGANSLREVSNSRVLPSFAVLDELVYHLRDVFPNLTRIVFTGHSAGGQVTQRYAALSPAPDVICSNGGISMRFVVANPSSYVYMDGQRAQGSCLTQFSIPSNAVSDYNEYGYGLEDLYAYGDLQGAATIRTRFGSRVVTYLMGEQDNNPNSSSLDTSPEAMLQGANRYERGLKFYAYVLNYYGGDIATRHNFSTVTGVGHTNLGMYTSLAGLYALFENNIQSCN